MDKKKIKNILKRFKERAIPILTSPWRLLKFVCFSLGALCLLFMLVTAFLISDFFSSLPNDHEYEFRKLKNRAHRITLKRFDSRAKSKKFRWTPLRRVNRNLLYAIVMSEDGSFFKHNGVNYTAIVDSFAKNFKKGEYASGGSTITQQVAKNIFLTHQKKLGRKLKEVFVTKKLEKNLRKNEILEIYLNIAEFGPDIYGIRMATLEYFKKLPSKINAAQGAFLAIMLPSPRKYYHSIFKGKNLSSKRRRKIRRILKDMLYEEVLTPQNYKKALRYRYF